MLAIQILGVNGHQSTKTLTKNTLTALKELDIMAKVEEVSDIDHLIEYDITGLPAIVIDGKLRFQQYVPEVADLKLLIQVLTKSTQNRKIMKNIIVPTDFSYPSKDAYLFAVAIAEKVKAAVEVVHIYSGSFNTRRPYTVKAGMGRYESLMDDLAIFTQIEDRERVIVQSKVSVTSKAIGGPTEKNLIKLSNEPDTFLMVMGMTGASISNERIFGSVSKVISQKANCPVLLIPKDTNFNGFKHILFASDYDSVEAQFLRQAVAFSKPFKATFHFIHVQEENDWDLNIELEDRLFKYLFAEGDPTYAFNMATIDAKTVTEGLNQYIEENEIDLVIMVAHKRNLWERILHKSITKEMAITTKVPILVYHKDYFEN